MSTEQAGSRSDYSPEVDGLRAFAVTGVIIDHFGGRLLPEGFLGVDIFFVISGFVITGSLYRRPGKSLGDLLLGFYVRRVKRLVPALVLCVAVTSIAICLFSPRPGESLATGIAALFGASNIYLLIQSTNYFGSLAQLNVFTHTWSLGVEEQFYLIFPLIIWITGFGRRACGGLLALAGAAGLLAIGSALAYVRVSHIDQTAAFFLMPTRLWELMAGCLAFLALTRFGRAAESLPLGAISLAAIAGMLAIFLVRFDSPVRATLAIVLLTAILIFCLRPESLVARLLRWQPVLYIGRISYALYLWHWSVISLSHWTVGIHWWTVPFQLALMLLLAAGSYRYLERPLRRATWSAKRWRSVGYGMGALGTTAALLVALMFSLDADLYTGNRAAQTLADESLTAGYSLADGSSWQGAPCVLANDSEVGKAIQIAQCTLGNFAQAKRRVLVVGNSYAAAFVPAFDDLVLSDRFAVMITSSWGASPVPEVTNHTPWAAASDYYWKQVIPSLVARLSPGDWVFLVADLSGLRRGPGLEQLKQGLAGLSDRLRAQGIKLAVLGALPLLREAACEPTVAAMTQWFTALNNPCHFYSRSETLAQLASLRDALALLQQQHKIAIIDLMEVFCPGATCTYSAKDGSVLYRDASSHVSVEAARLSAPTIRHILLAPEALVSSSP